MKDSKRTFLQATMNRDLDERLLPQGVYRYANNVRVGSSEGDDGGAAKTVRGNKKLTSLNYPNAVTIGRFADGINQLMYWCVTSDTTDAVIEYDAVTKQTSKVLESDKGGILNFDKYHLITGINKIYNGDPEKDLLAITDDFNPPRIFNIARSKKFKINAFKEKDISVIKAMPRFAPVTNMTYTSSSLENNIVDKMLMFATRYVYLDNEISAASTYSYPAFIANSFKLDYQTLENLGMVNAFNAVDITFNTGDETVKAIQVLVKSTNSNTEYIVETFTKTDLNWSDDSEETFTFSNDRSLVALPSQELYRAFDNVPHLAKAQDFIGNRLVYANYLENYDIIDKNGNDITIDFQLALFSENLEGEPLTTTFGSSSNASDMSYVSFDFSGIELVKGSALYINLDMDSPRGESYNMDFTFVFNRDFIDADDLAKDESFKNFINKIITGNWVSNYNPMLPDNGSIFDNSDFAIAIGNSTIIKLHAPTMVYKIDNSPNPDTTERVDWNFTASTSAYINNAGVKTSLKTNRSYEIAIIYRDLQGRATTALTSLKNTLYIPQRVSTFKNKIQVQVNHKAPAWADRYQFVIKQNKSNYETIYAVNFYIDGLYRWVKLEGANKDKVKEGDTLIVKSDLSGIVTDVTTTRVIEITTKEADFIEGNTGTGESNSPIIEQSGLYMKIKPQGFDMSVNNDHSFKTYTRTKAVKKGQPTIHIGVPEGSLGGEWNEETGKYEDIPITAGSQISIFFKNWESDGFEEVYDKNFIVQQDYSDFQTWFEAEVQDLGEAADHFSLEWRRIEGFDSSLEGSQRLLVTGLESGTTFERSKITGTIDIIFNEGIVIFETDPTDAEAEIYYETSETYLIEDGKHLGNVQDQTTFKSAIVELDVFNCFPMGNGAECYKVKDALNTNFLKFDLRPTTASIEKYQAVRRQSDLTWSGNYLEENSLNGLGEFNLSLANFNNSLDKKYGSIQKVLARDTNLVTFQEDKVHYILYGKDLLSNADGSGNVTSSPEILTQPVAFTGEYGISKNPESVAVNGKVVYFSDARRGAILRLSADGITEISRYGLNSDFIELFKNSIYKKKVGGFDPYNNEYVFASENVPIYSVNSLLSCNESYSRNEFSGTVSFDMDFGLLTGNGSLQITKNEKPISVYIKYNGMTTGRNLGVSTSANVTFSKPTSNPQRATVTVEALEEGSEFNIQGVCIVPQTMTVITVVVGDDGDINQTILNRYRYFNNDVSSSFVNFESKFPKEGAAIYNVRSDIEGSTSVPNPSSTVTLESYKGNSHSATFENDDRLGYLVSNALYNESQTDSLLLAANFGSIDKTTLPTGDIINQTNFVFQRPSNEKYLYLIYDYSLKNLPPVAVDDSYSVKVGNTIEVDLRLNDLDPDFDPLTVIIVSQPQAGTVTVLSNGKVSYTHNGSMTLDDSFTYKVTDGKVESNLATVSIFVGVSCEDGINASGTRGIYEATIVLGTGTGLAGINYDARGVPDRFQLWYDGQKVADTKYVGGYLTGDPQGYTSAGSNGTSLKGQHTDLPIKQFNGTGFIDTGNTTSITVTQNDIANNSNEEPSQGQGVLTFFKHFETPVTMTIKVFAPLGNTGWNMSGICPYNPVQ